jgi:hypothetical protein
MIEQTEFYDKDGRTNYSVTCSRCGAEIHLENMTFEEANTYLQEEEGWLFNKGLFYNHWCPECKEIMIDIWR